MARLLLLYICMKNINTQILKKPRQKRDLSHNRKYDISLASNDTGNIVWKINRTSNSNVKSVIITGTYRPGIFSNMVGVLTLNGFDILNAKSYRQNGRTLDIFNVRVLPGHVLEDKGFACAENDLKSVLSGKLDISAEVHKMTHAHEAFKLRIPQSKPYQVVVDNKDSFVYSVIEVRGYDFPGILFRITEAIFNCGLHVWSAKITTKADKIFDVFYVKDFKGQKIDSPDRASVIRTAVEKALAR